MDLARGLFAFERSPYCGAPPDPATLVLRWNLDPYLILVLIGLLVTYAARTYRRSRGDAAPSMYRQAAFYTGWGLGTLAVISPLCPLSVSLFSARIAQHMWLTSVVAPLIALGLPPIQRRSVGCSPLIAALAFGVFLWFWHAPGPYSATFESDVTYWAMHATLFGSAVWFWGALLRDPGRNLGAVMASAVATTVQMGLLGASITFAGRPLYAPHAQTTAAWGLTQLQDQQLGGVIMWIPAGLIIVGAVVGGLACALRRADQPQPLAAAT